MVGRLGKHNQDKFITHDSLTNSWYVVRDMHVQHKLIKCNNSRVPFVMLLLVIIFTKFHVSLKTFACQQQNVKDKHHLQELPSGLLILVRYTNDDI